MSACTNRRLCSLCGRDECFQPTLRWYAEGNSGRIRAGVIIDQTNRRALRWVHAARLGVHRHFQHKSSAGHARTQALCADELTLRRCAASPSLRLFFLSRRLNAIAAPPNNAIPSPPAVGRALATDFHSRQRPAIFDFFLGAAFCGDRAFGGQQQKVAINSEIEGGCSQCKGNQAAINMRGKNERHTMCVETWSNREGTRSRRLHGVKFF